MGIPDGSSEVDVIKLSSFYPCCSFVSSFVCSDPGTFCRHPAPHYHWTKLVSSFKTGSQVLPLHYIRTIGFFAQPGFLWGGSQRFGQQRT